MRLAIHQGIFMSRHLSWYSENYGQPLYRLRLALWTKLTPQSTGRFCVGAPSHGLALRRYRSIISSIRLHFRSNSLKCAISWRASAENRPCFQFARVEPASPNAVRGPVERPPCIRQRLLPRMAGQPQGVPLHVRAPHRDALAGFP
jgi:hypothetical protein